MILESDLLRKCLMKALLLIRSQLSCTYIMDATYEKVMVLESDLLRNIMPSKIFAFTKSQFQCTYIMGATYEKVMVLESDLLSLNLIKSPLLLRGNSVASV